MRRSSRASVLSSCANISASTLAVNMLYNTIPDSPCQIVLTRGKTNSQAINDKGINNNTNQRVMRSVVNFTVLAQMKVAMTNHTDAWTESHASLCKADHQGCATNTNNSNPNRKLMSDNQRVVFKSRFMPSRTSQTRESNNHCLALC